MSTVGIRELKQNASAVVAQAAAGTTVIVTDRGRPVAQLSPIAESPLARLVDASAARPPRRALSELPPPASNTALGDELARMRAAERY